MITNGFFEELFFKELAAQDKLDLESSREDIQLRDQFRLKWLQDGDINAAFFHDFINVKR